MAVLAKERGTSLSALITAWAKRAFTEAELEEAYRSEREARRLDAENPEVQAEDRLWETTLGDGI